MRRSRNRASGGSKAALRQGLVREPPLARPFGPRCPPDSGGRGASEKICSSSHAAIYPKQPAHDPRIFRVGNFGTTGDVESIAETGFGSPEIGFFSADENNEPTQGMQNLVHDMTDHLGSSSCRCVLGTNQYEIKTLTGRLPFSNIADVNSVCPLR